MMKMQALLFGVVLALAACTTTPAVVVVEPGTPVAPVEAPKQYTQEIEFACVGASAALKTLTVANNAGKLSPTLQQQILAAAGVVTPVCGAAVAPSMTTVAYNAFLQAVVLLQSRAKLF